MSQSAFSGSVFLLNCHSHDVSYVSLLQCAGGVYTETVVG